MTMPCLLATPRWDLLHRAGLQSSIRDPLSNSTTLSWGLAHPTLPNATVFYNLYWSNDIITLFDYPKAFTEGTLTASIPTELAPNGYIFGVKASQYGVVSNFDGYLDNLNINNALYSYPNLITSTASFSTLALDGYLEVNSTSGYPLMDGYLKIGNEVVLYESITTYLGSPAFKIKNWDPFGCNDGYNFASGQSVELFVGFEEGNTIAFAATGACFLPRATWVDKFNIGIYEANDLGIGTAVELLWGLAEPPTGYQLHYNIYATSFLGDLFDSPIGISREQSAVVPGLRPGDGYFFGVQASYFPVVVDITEMNRLSQNLYEFPPTTTINEYSGSYSSSDTGPMVVQSTEGYPDAGILRVGDEIMAYGGKTPATFIISRRDYFDRGNLLTHANGTAVEFFRGVEDNNGAYYRAVPTWDDGTIPPLLSPDGYEIPGSMQDSDGYRTWKNDLINEDHEEYEESFINIPTKSYCGYRTTDFNALYTKNVCNTYFGGREDGFGGGIDLNASNIQRQEFLLGTTGEPWTLLRVKTKGRQCRRFSLRHEHTSERCPICFGTKIEGGFTRWAHPRKWRSDRDNVEGFIPLRVAPYLNDTPLTENRGRAQVDQLTVWGPSVPTIKKGDILIRYVLDGSGEPISEEFRYEVVNVTRNNIILGYDGKQDLTIRKLDKTHIIYTFPNPPFSIPLA